MFLDSWDRDLFDGEPRKSICEKYFQLSVEKLSTIFQKFQKISTPKFFRFFSKFSFDLAQKSWKKKNIKFLQNPSKMHKNMFLCNFEAFSEKYFPKKKKSNIFPDGPDRLLCKIFSTFRARRCCCARWYIIYKSIPLVGIKWCARVLKTLWSPSSRLP